MELMRRHSVMDNSRILCLTAALFIAVSNVCADVNINNAYSAMNSEGHERVSLHNMDYSNSVSLSTESFSAESEAHSADKTEKSKFKHDLWLDSQGARLEATGRDLSYNKIFYGGIQNGGQFQYSMDSGRSQASYYTPSTYVNEDIISANSRYGATFGVSGLNLYSSGRGWSNSFAPSSFIHGIHLQDRGVFCTIKSFLESKGDSSGNVPVSYDWSSYTSKSLRGFAGLEIHANQGNRAVDLAIKGISSFLSDKYSPDSWAKGIPEHLEPLKTGTRESRALYMQYAINQR
jgi:hypothetical protein